MLYYEILQFIPFTETKRINIVKEACNGLTVHWINQLGGLSDWVFENTQQHSIIEKANSMEFKNEEFDYQKTAHEEIEVYLENEDIKYMNGFKGLIYALQIWIDNEKVRIKQGTFKLYKIGTNRFNFSCTFIKKKINLGHL